MHEVDKITLLRLKASTVHAEIATFWMTPGVPEAVSPNCIIVSLVLAASICSYPRDS